MTDGKPRRRPRWSAWLTSLAVHLVAGLLAAAIVLPPVQRAVESRLFSEWTAPEPSDPEPELSVTATDLNPHAGGASTGQFDPAAVLAPSSLPMVSPNLERASVPLLSPSSPLALAQTVTPLPTAESTGGAGRGTGTGVGDGKGPGFFGMTPPQGKRVVFVVDNSRSMNSAHNSPARTRFRRVKLELLKCITEMAPDQGFYVIFFSNETLPLPHNGYVSAAPGVRDAAMQWIGTAEAHGSPTDPTKAIDLALRLQPDAICFLTDGEFNDLVNRRLRSLKQPRTEIHTFAIGETYGEEVLKLFAEHNRGEYRFIP